MASFQLNPADLAHVHAHLKKVSAYGNEDLFMPDKAYRMTSW